jgi:hypothetical protein
MAGGISDAEIIIGSCRSVHNQYGERLCADSAGMSFLQNAALFEIRHTELYCYV